MDLTIDFAILLQGTQEAQEQRQRRESREQREAQEEQSALLSEDDTYFQIVSSAWYDAVTILNSRRGEVAVWQFIRAYTRYSGLPDVPDVSDDQCAWLRDTFLRKLRSMSPLLAIVNCDLRTVGYHPRGTWDGNYIEFNPRQQAICINRYWIDNIINERSSSATSQSSSARRGDMLKLAVFKIVHTFTHEIFHLLVTFLGRGQTFTPRAMRPPQSDQTSTDIGEGGELREQLLYGGLVVCRSRETERTGPFYLLADNGTAARVTIDSIDELLEGTTPLDPRAPLLMTEGDCLPAWEFTRGNGSQAPLFSRQCTHGEWRRSPAPRHRVRRGLVLHGDVLQAWLEDSVRPPRPRR